MTELFYINSDKGKVLTLIGGIFTLIVITFIVIIHIISLYFELLKIFIESFRVILFKQELNYIEFVIFIIILYFYEIIDSFIDGLIMITIKIIFVFVLFFIILEAGFFVVLFRFIFLEIDFLLNFTLFILILLFAYFWILIWEVIIIYVKIHTEKEVPSPQIRIRKSKKKWIDSIKDTIITESDEKLFDNWTNVELYERKSVKYFFLSTLILIGTGFIYGIINYILFDVPAKGYYFNNFVFGLFFPFWSIIFTAFLSIRHYIRAIIYFSFMIFLELYLYSKNLITVEGVFFIQYIIIFSTYLSIDLRLFFSSLSPLQLFEHILTYIGILFIFEFILLIITFFISLFNQKSRKVQLLASSYNLYIRQEETYNSWNLLFDLFNIALWPFNPYNWKEFIKKVRYAKEGKKESLFYNYGRLSYNKTIKTLRKYEANWRIFILKIAIYIIIGIFTLKYYIGYILFAGVIIEILRFVRSFKKIKIKIKYQQNFAEGSFFMKENFDILIIYGIPRIIAEKFKEKTIV